MSGIWRNGGLIILALACASGVARAGDCASSQGQGNAASAGKPAESPDKDLVQIAAGAGNFRTLSAALQASGLTEELKAKGPFTVFAPTDDAFAKLGTAAVAELLQPENKQSLIAILTYHVVPTKVLAKDVRTAGVPTLNGQRLSVVASDATVRVDGAAVVTTDILASNGVIHAIDTVLMPSDKNVVQTAIDAGSFKTLARLLTAADLVSALQGAGPFTVFAPTDEAFARIDAKTLDSLARPENKAKLVEILKYHVVKGRVYSDQAVKAGKAKTLAGQSVEFTPGKKGSLLVNDAKVIKPDLNASNGVIHVIDAVIMPD